MYGCHDELMVCNDCGRRMFVKEMVSQRGSISTYNMTKISGMLQNVRQTADNETRNFPKIERKINLTKKAIKTSLNTT